MTRRSIRRLILAGGSALVVAGLGTGSALAASAGPQATPPATSSHVAPAAPVKAVVVTSTASGPATHADTASQPDSTTPESTTPESTTPEAGAPSDGPGGHADSPSDPNVDHQFDGQE